MNSNRLDYRPACWYNCLLESGASNRPISLEGADSQHAAPYDLALVYGPFEMKLFLAFSVFGAMAAVAISNSLTNLEFTFIQIIAP